MFLFAGASGGQRGSAKDGSSWVILVCAMPVTLCVSDAGITTKMPVSWLYEYARWLIFISGS